MTGAGWKNTNGTYSLPSVTIPSAGTWIVDLQLNITWSTGSSAITFSYALLNNNTPTPEIPQYGGLFAKPANIQSNIDTINLRRTIYTASSINIYSYLYFITFTSCLLEINGNQILSGVSSPSFITITRIA